MWYLSHCWPAKRHDLSVTVHWISQIQWIVHSTSVLLLQSCCHAGDCYSPALLTLFGMHLALQLLLPGHLLSSSELIEHFRNAFLGLPIEETRQISLRSHGELVF